MEGHQLFELNYTQVKESFKRRSLDPLGIAPGLSIFETSKKMRAEGRKHKNTIAVVAKEWMDQLPLMPLSNDLSFW